MTLKPDRPAVGPLLPDPAHVSTAAQLADAAKELMTLEKLSGGELARRAELSTGTVSGLINAKVFPQEETFRKFVAVGCGRPWEPWRQAWARAHGDALRRRPLEDVAGDVERLQRDVEELSGALSAALDRLAALEDRVASPGGDSHPDGSDEEYSVLESVPAPRFVVDNHWQPDKPDEMFYEIRDVDAFLDAVRIAATVPGRLKHYLRTTPGTFPYPRGDTNYGYRTPEVDEYVSHLRSAVGLG